MNERKNIKGFFSYSHQNEKHGRGKLSLLRELLEIELREQTGENIEIFQDIEDIAWGEIWKTKIIKSLDSSKFLIAIVTPSYLRSEFCRFELEYFLSLEKTIGSERILPLIYIETPDLKNIKDPIFAELNNRQYFDVTKLRLSSLKSTSSKRQLEKFSRRIRELIVEEIYVTSTNTPNPSIDAIINSNPSFQKDSEELPPPSTDFPAGWDEEWQPSFDNAAIASKSNPKLKKKDEPITPPLVTRAVEALKKTSDPKNNAIIPSLYVPLTKNDPNTKPRQITIVFRGTGDGARDNRRIKTLYGTLISYHGQDKFSFQILENGKNRLFDFPNDTTRICPELLNRLNILGKDSLKIKIEDIKFP